MGERPKDKYDWASEYYHFDWEYAQTPEVRGSRHAEGVLADTEPCYFVN